MKLEPQDAKALKALIRWTERADRSASDYLKEVEKREADLSPEARQAWETISSDKLRAELAKWRPAYLIERTRQGYRVRRFIKNRAAYATRPERAGLTKAETAKYDHLIRF